MPQTSFQSCESCGREAEVAIAGEPVNVGLVKCSHCGHEDYTEGTYRKYADEDREEREANYRSKSRRKSRIKFKVA